ncbi:uncharacterized protein LOC118194452 [Stegodyphus dumicola]|uniref:uncharacterized protein LOC118194452 n=1 Tax=Stegodyphus dumicola TaxID=202533 RepID=UPI0015A7E51A|nr:uncharacterized protein LOC118194452 [Stegodyphus dumicola]
MTIHIVSKPNGRDSKPQTIPISASKVCDDTGFCIVVYGCHKKPIFEKVNISECPKNLTLLRNKCSCCSDCSEKRNLEVCSLIENGFKSKDVSSLNGSFKSKKQKPLDSEKKYTHVTENEYTEQTEALKTKPKLILNEARLPNLPSNMKKRLKIAEDESIFQCTDEEKIKNLTENLSKEDVAAILKELHSRLLQNQRHLPGVRKWIKYILAAHLLHLNTNKDLADILHSIEQLTDARRTSETLSKMSTLKGLLRIYQTKAISQELNFPSDVEDMET